SAPSPLSLHDALPISPLPLGRRGARAGAREPRRPPPRPVRGRLVPRRRLGLRRAPARGRRVGVDVLGLPRLPRLRAVSVPQVLRSEEHTSELQSQSNL